jgi:ribonuclease P protein component
MRLRFPRTARLTRTSEFARVRTEGKTEHGKFMVCQVARVDSPIGGARFGIVTSRRVGPAVVRNRVRRRFREIVRVDRPLIPAEYWIVLVAKAAAASAKPGQLQDEWRRLAKRAGLLLVA